MSLAHFNHHIQLYAFPAMLILITQEIPLTYLEIGILGSLPVLIMALFSPLIGYFGKSARTGFNILLIGIFLFAISSFMFAISNDFSNLIIGNALLGFGCTTFHPVGLGVSANSYSGKNRGKALAVVHAAGVIGTAVSPVITLGIAVFVLNWRQTYFFLGIGTFVFLFMMIIWLFFQNLISKYQLLIKDNSQEVLEEVSGPSSNKSIPSYRRWILITLGLLLIISSFRSGVYRLISYFTVRLLSDFYQFSSFNAGLITSFILLLGSSADIYGAYISDKSGSYGRVKIIILSAIGTAVSIFLLMFLTENDFDTITIIIGFSFFAICFYLAGGTLQALMSDLVPQKERTFFYSLVFSIGLVVSSASPAIFGVLLDIFQSPIAGFVFMLILICISLFVSLVFRKRLSFAVENDLITP
jgi:DHA1 family multidrug resistance protein-like MFS transporter